MVVGSGVGNPKSPDAGKDGLLAWSVPFCAGGVAGEQWEDSRMGLTDPALDEPALDTEPAACGTGRSMDGGHGW